LSQKLGKTVNYQVSKLRCIGYFSFFDCTGLKKFDKFEMIYKYITNFQECYKWGQNKHFSP